MNTFFSSPKTAGTGRDQLARLFASALLATLLLSLGSFSALAQGLDNPTGPTGTFGMASNTGGSYSPYTANATRVIPDLTVAGAVGAYPLQWSRIMNSRAYGGGVFGEGGGWKHSYQWSCSASENVTAAPDSYTVNYPDGRVVTFAANIGTPYLSPVGVTDRFGGIANSGYVYLYLTDGGRVRFYQTAKYWPPVGGDPAYYSFTLGPADQIIDPYGQITTLTYNTSDKLTQVKEAGGRYLSILYGTNGYISRVDSYTAAGHATQWVQYTYATQSFGGANYVVLKQADYIYTAGAEPPPIAYYTYQTSNTSPNGNPLISTCKDVRYPGPMKNIAYTFVRTNPLSYGELSQEKNFNGTLVETLTVNTTNNTRTELRSDGKSRIFTYGATLGTGGVTKTYLLKSYTDFAGHVTTLTYDADGFVSSSKDANNHTTSFTYLNGGFPTGVITKITHPSDSQTPASSIQYFYTDITGAYLDHVTDELGHTTYYKRNADQTTYEIDYLDGGVEKYSYNGFNQVASHTMPSNASGTTGGTETYTYDGTGLLKTYTPPATGSDQNPGSHPTKYAYDLNDRLSTSTDPKGNVTSFSHNEIGQVTIVQHAGTSQGADYYAYNADGTLQTQSIQLDASNFADTNYVYDDYKRLLTVTDPLNNVTKYWYDKAGTGVSDLSHTDANVTLLVLPNQTIPARKIKTVYDANLRKDTVTAGFSTVDAATTNYDYDLVGNLTAVTDPNGQKTSYFYDARDRLVHVNDPIATDRNSDGYTTSYTYDLASNKKSEKRANDQTITYDTYDVMNRLTQMTVHQGITADAISHYTWTKAGKIDTFTDPGGNIYNYDYDTLNRLITTTFPSGGGTETRFYDISGNPFTFKNRGGATQTFTYDARNRETKYVWSTGNPQTRLLTYDDASRVLSCNTVDSSSTVLTGINFTYLDDGSLKTQEEWGNKANSYGDGIHRTITYGYADGNRATVAYPGTASYAYAYTGRNQLKNMTWSYDDSNVVSYVYDPNGNPTSRTPGNNPASSYLYDALNRVTKITHNFTGTSKTINYGYTEVGNRKFTQRDGNGTTGTADGYTYDLNDQMKTFRLNGTLANGVVSGGTLTSFNLDESGNRTSVVVGSTTTNYGAVNNLNEYTTVGGLGVTYGALGNLSVYNSWNYSYDAMGRLTSADKGAITSDFLYDGLGRQVARTESGVTTYSIYDGWNLVSEYDAGGTLLNRTIHADGDLVRSLNATPTSQQIYYYADGNGSTTHLADVNGTLVERYTYDAYGTPTFYNGGGTVLNNGTAYQVDQLFTGQKWYSQLGLYDLRHRAYLPSLGRFLQPDPIGFAGDSANLYRYVGNNPVNASDPSGLAATNKTDGSGSNDPEPPRGIYDGTQGAGIYAFNRGHLGTNLGGMLEGVMHDSYTNLGGLSYNGKPVIAISFNDVPRARAVSNVGNVSSGPGGAEFNVNLPYDQIQALGPAANVVTNPTGGGISMEYSVSLYDGPGGTLGLQQVTLDSGQTTTFLVLGSGGGFFSGQGIQVGKISGAYNMDSMGGWFATGSVSTGGLQGSSVLPSGTVSYSPSTATSVFGGGGGRYGGYGVFGGATYSIPLLGSPPPPGR
ncbi:MAG: RHS repeat domain-containing protein [Chthoniobacterales bacterium]